MTLADRLTDILTGLLREMVDAPDGVRVSSVVGDGGKTIVFTIRADRGDLGKVIGKQGRNASALRTLWEGIGSKNGVRVVLEVDDGERCKRRRTRNGNGGEL